MHFKLQSFAEINKSPNFILYVGRHNPSDSPITKYRIMSEATLNLNFLMTFCEINWIIYSWQKKDISRSKKCVILTHERNILGFNEIYLIFSSCLTMYSESLNGVLSTPHMHVKFHFKRMYSLACKSDRKFW